MTQTRTSEESWNNSRRKRTRRRNTDKEEGEREELNSTATIEQASKVVRYYVENPLLQSSEEQTLIAEERDTMVIEQDFVIGLFTRLLLVDGFVVVRFLLDRQMKVMTISFRCCVRTWPAATTSSSTFSLFLWPKNAVNRRVTKQEAKSKQKIWSDNFVSKISRRDVSQTRNSSLFNWQLKRFNFRRINCDGWRGRKCRTSLESSSCWKSHQVPGYYVYFVISSLYNEIIRFKVGQLESRIWPTLWRCWCKNGTECLPTFVQLNFN